MSRNKPLARLLALLLLVVSLLISCQGAEPAPVEIEWRSVPSDVLTLPEGFSAEIITDKLQSPTQMILGADGNLWVAQLAGGENSGEGQIVTVAPETGEIQVQADDLLKPTGIAFWDDYLWVALANQLARMPLDDAGQLGELEIVFDKLPFNGRSNGTLTVTPDDQLLYQTSGRLNNNQAAPRSGILWMLEHATSDPQQFATGLKLAYAHTFDTAGQLWGVDINDDPVEGGVMLDEINRISQGNHYGWPSCFGQNEPAAEYGGNAARCQQSHAPHTIFPPHATPTSIVLSPWNADELLVALWLPGVVVRVPIDEFNVDADGNWETYIEGFRNPQHLLALSDSSLLVSDYTTGAIYRVVQDRDDIAQGK